MVLKVKLLLAVALAFISLTAQSSDISIQAQQSLDRCQYRHAAELFEQAIAESNNKQPQGAEYALNLAGYAEAIQTTDFNKADSLYVKSLAILDKIKGQELNYARVLQNLVEVRMTLQKNDGVEQMLDKVLKIKAQKFGTKSIEYAEAWSLLAWNDAVGSKLKKANEIIGKALEIASKKAPNTFLHGVILHRATMLAFYEQNPTKAEQLYTQASAIFEKTCPPLHRKVIESKANMAMLYAQTRRVDQARDMITELLKLIEQETGKQDYTYSILLSTLGSIYAFEGNAPVAIPMFEESIAQNKRLFGELHGSHFSALNNLAQLYMRVDDLEKAEALLVESMRIRKQLYGESSTHYIQALNGLGILYQKMGDYKRSIQHLRKTAELSKIVMGESSRNYIYALSNLAISNHSIEDYNQAVEFANLSEQTMAKYKIEDKSEFVELRTKHQIIMLSGGKYKGKSVAEVIKTAEKVKELYGEKNIAYQDLINSLCVHYNKEGDYEVALRFALLNKKLTKQYRGKDNFAYLSSLVNLASSYYKQKMMQQAEEALSESLEVMKELALKNFAFMSGKEREDYWLSIQNTVHIIEESVALATDRNSVTPSMNTLLYNTTLFTKALLLNYSTNIQQSIARSGDADLISTWEQLQKLKMSTKQDVEQIANLERKLALKSKPYQEQQQDISIKWSDIRDNLDKNEAAIEIISIRRVGATPKLHYYALIIRPEYTHPQLIKLCDEASIKKALSKGSDVEIGLYNTLFAPLETHLNGVQKLYIASTGLINRISFAGLKQNGVYLIDRYSMHNLLSTRDVIKRKEQQKEKINSITLFGGADFALSDKELSQSNNSPLALNNPVESLSEKVDLSRGQGFDYLPGSKKEVIEIGNMLQKLGWKSNIYTDINATETQFKNLSSASTDVIHVATHGYYFALKDSANKKLNSFTLSNDPLIRSGLLFSGANNIWSNNLRENLTDDGVLTGYEISLMDLTQNKLVVLSACNTALGDIDYLEGVYGLQRAFRMAGAQSILVSLWEISDKETISFMKSFYSNLTSGDSIRKAFDKTIRKIRLANPTNSKLWAGFVLIE